jgi:hypothetical protein
VIYAVWATPKVIHGGDLVHWTVRTSNDVTRVTAGIPAYEFTLERRSTGRFFTAFRIPPDVPPFFRRDYRIVVTAFRGDGATTRTSLTVRFQ